MPAYKIHHNFDLHWLIKENKRVDLKPQSYISEYFSAIYDLVVPGFREIIVKCVQLLLSPSVRQHTQRSHKLKAPSLTNYTWSVPKSYQLTLSTAFYLNFELFEFVRCLFQFSPEN